MWFVPTPGSDTADGGAVFSMWQFTHESSTMEWKPGVPGIDAPGSYDDYAKEPARFIYR